MSKRDMSTLRTLSKELETKLEPAMKSSFGITGRPIMITQNSPKQIRITKDGIDICNLFLGHVHPLLDHVLQHIHRHHHVLKYCDGSKTIVLKVASLIRVLDKNLGNISSSNDHHIRFLGSVSRELDRFRSLALPKIVESLRGSILQSVDTSLLRGPQIIRKSMIKGFLDTRLNPTVVRHLVPLIADHFTEHQNVQFMDKPICFAVGNASVDESISVAGFPLFSNGPKKTIPDEFFHTIVIWIPRDLSTENAKYSASGSPIAYRDFDWKRRLMEHFLTQIQQRFGITLLVCTFSLPVFARAILAELQITVLEYVPEAECLSLADKLKICPWRGLPDGSLGREMESIHVISLNHSIKSHILGSKLVHLFPVPKQNAFILCGPTTTLANSYKSSVEQCLNLIQASEPLDETNITKLDMDKEFLASLINSIPDVEFEVLHPALRQMLKEHIWFKRDLLNQSQDIYYDSLTRYLSQLRLILDVLKRIVTIDEVVFLGKQKKVNNNRRICSVTGY